MDNYSDDEEIAPNVEEVEVLEEHGEDDDGE
jgi:hypothetical protein